MSSSPKSNALIRKSTETELMPPPPIKRIKRPPKVLDEDTYTDALSEIIARDFFPGLLESQHQQEYLNALESRDDEWIAEASRKLTEVMNTPQHRRRGTSFATPRFHNASATPTIGRAIGATPMTEATDASQPEKPKVETHMSLDAFQAKYTSEDNSSFNTLLDKQNEKKRNAYAFLWNGNHIPGFRTKAHMKRLKENAENAKKNGDVKLIVAADQRPAIPNTWKAEPRNGLMFTPDKSPPPPERGEGEKELPPKAVVYSNTRMPPPALTSDRPPSPSSTMIEDAIAGRLRPTDSEPGFGYAESPRVNGYSFVDDAPSPSASELGAPPLTWGNVAAVAQLEAAPSSAPFKIAATPQRELLHHRMVEKVAKNKRVPTRAMSSTVATPRMTPLGGGGKGREIPKFASSPALTPAGQRLWGNLTGGRKQTGLRESLVKDKETPFGGGSSGKGFRWTPTPRAAGK
ncbi:nuclear protein DGCR14 [Geopyxis carbonaria]|nr:nuclear protein DGCR14 [Geopyxis carbonaria]